MIHPAAMRSFAQTYRVKLIDIEEQTWQWLKSVGPDGALLYFVFDKIDPSINDRTHLTGEGAVVIVGMVADCLKKLRLC